MINNIFKTIHNKYSTLFKFIFFLRYIFIIFFTALVLFLSIPHFFDFENNDEFIKNYLLEVYSLKIDNYENIKYHSLPIPHLKIKNINLITKTNLLKINAASLSIYPKIINIYNYENFEVKKIIINNNKILLEDTDLKFLFQYIHKLKKRITFKNLDLLINKKNKPLINIKKISFTNYGYNKNIIRGKLFDKEFKILVSDKYDKVNLVLLKTGVAVEVYFNEIKEDSSISGFFKSKLLNSSLKFDFKYDDKKLQIFNSLFRNKNLSFKNESTIIYKPFFSSKSIFKIEDINLKILQDLNIIKIFNTKNLIKKINTKNEIKFKSKRLNNYLVDDLNLDINMAYGRLKYSKNISILKNLVTCNGDINLLEDYPILYFNCLIVSKNKKNFLKNFSIKYKNKNEPFTLIAKGNISIINNKINFEKIKLNEDYNATKQDLIYFKRSFEDILFDKDFSGIFDLKKIKRFILEIS